MVLAQGWASDSLSREAGRAGRGVVPQSGIPEANRRNAFTADKALSAGKCERRLHRIGKAAC
jgi:hypothetical protein